MIVIERNGKRSVVTGWRAWLIGAAVVVGLTALFAVLGFVLLGVAITASALMIIAVPVAVVLAALAAVFGRR